MKELMIKCNIGPEERKVRLLVGAAAAAGALAAKSSGLRAALGVVGLVGFATAASRYSPLYHAFGINHCQPAYRAFPRLLRRL